MSDLYVSNSSSSLFISSSSSENVSPISVNRSNPRANSAKSSQDSLPLRIPVYVNVYDMASANSYLYWFGLGIYHSGLYLPTFNAEFCFGGHDIDGLTGVFQVPPKTGVPGLIFRKSVFVGNATVSETEVHQILRAMSLEYTGKSYNLLTRNCNHFTTDLAQRLCSKSPPKWINRLASLALMVPCMIPAELQPENPTEDHLLSHQYQQSSQPANRVPMQR